MSFFKETYFHDFKRFFNNFLCKRKLRSCSKKFKSFLPPSLVFYPTFLALKFAQISCSQLIYAQLSMLQKWGKKLVRGGKELLNRKVWYLSFLLHQKSCRNIKNLRKSIYFKIGKNEKKISRPKKWNFFKFLLPPKKHFNFFQFSSKSIFASF